MRTMNMIAAGMTAAMLAIPAGGLSAAPQAAGGESGVEQNTASVREHASLQPEDSPVAGTVLEQAVPLPRPRPLFFDLRIDMKDMLGAEELAWIASDHELVDSQDRLLPDSDSVGF